MSTTLKMLALNVPLSQWRKFEQEDRVQTAWHGGKATDKAAAKIFSQLCHHETVSLVAREFDNYPADLRLALRTLCNKREGSGNVSKGVQRLDKMMCGNLLREQANGEHFRVETWDGWRSKRVDPAVAGATRKYGIVK